MIQSPYIRKWSNIWQTRIILSKCVTLKCYRSLSPILTDYFINYHNLENMKQYSYLIINLCLSFFTSVMSLVKLLNYSISSKVTCTNVSSIPNQMHILILFNHPQNVLVQYEILTIKHVACLQRKCKEQLLNGHMVIMITTVVCLPCCKILITGLNLQYHRQRARLSLFYKSLHNIIALEIILYYIPNNHLSILRIYHQSSYTYPCANTNMYLHVQHFLKTISAWNSLRTEITFLQHCQLFKASQTPLYIITFKLFVITYNFDFLSTVLYMTIYVM